MFRQSSPRPFSGVQTRNPDAPHHVFDGDHAGDTDAIRPPTGGTEPIGATPLIVGGIESISATPTGGTESISATPTGGTESISATPTSGTESISATPMIADGVLDQL